MKVKSVKVKSKRDGTHTVQIGYHGVRGKTQWGKPVPSTNIGLKALVAKLVGAALDAQN